MTGSRNERPVGGWPPDGAAAAPDPHRSGPCSAGLRAGVLGLAIGIALVPVSTRAETISSALARAYMTNPDLNQQRASTRATDENVSRAKSSYRPQVMGTGSVGFNHEDLNLGLPSSATSSTTGTGTTGTGTTGAGTTGTGTGAAATSSSFGTINSNTFPSTAQLTVT